MKWHDEEAVQFNLYRFTFLYIASHWSSHFGAWTGNSRMTRHHITEVQSSLPLPSSSVEHHHAQEYGHQLYHLRLIILTKFIFFIVLMAWSLRISFPVSSGPWKGKRVSSSCRPLGYFAQLSGCRSWPSSSRSKHDGKRWRWRVQLMKMGRRCNLLRKLYMNAWNTTFNHDLDKPTSEWNVPDICKTCRTTTVMMRNTKTEDEGEGENQFNT